MHRLILGVTDPEILVDHADFNGLNCQRDNIRIATRFQNNCNSRKHNGSSKYIGVLWSKQANKWLAKVKINGKATHVGYFTDEETAARARDKKAVELHGEFANLNFK